MKSVLFFNSPLITAAKRVDYLFMIVILLTVGTCQLEPVKQNPFTWAWPLSAQVFWFMNHSHKPVNCVIRHHVLMSKTVFPYKLADDIAGICYQCYGSRFCFIVFAILMLECSFSDTIVQIVCM
jgi:hypothetical protein